MSHIRIRLESDMCVASGESSGNSIDSDICINPYGLPYIPARRIKGCLRYAAEELMKMGYKSATSDNIELLFGNAYGLEGILQISDGNMNGSEGLNHYLNCLKTGKTGTALLRKNANPICVSNIFTDVLGQTRMQDGVKVDNTLRFTRVLNQYDPLITDAYNNSDRRKLQFVAPVVLNICTKGASDKEEELLDLIANSCKTLRHMGLNRNRGLGNIIAELIIEQHSSKNADSEEIIAELDKLDCGKEDRIEISWSIVLDAPVSIPGPDGYEAAIPGRSVIGCMAGEYLKDHPADDKFSDLFLDGRVKWSPLTPVVDGKISHPTPLMLMELKNGGKKKINRYTQEDSSWSAQKPKTLDETYAVMTGDGYAYVNPLFRMSYHHSIRQEKLYTQNALEEGMIYGGTVRIDNADKDLARDVVRLLHNAKLNFGRSKSAQYSTCSLLGINTPKAIVQEKRVVDKGEPLFAVLQSDLIINEAGMYTTDAESVRNEIAQNIKKADAMSICEDDNEVPIHPEGFIDVCQYKTISGFQSMWHLQKPHIVAVKAGSVYCFVSNGGYVPDIITLGEYMQEGFGICRILSLDELKKNQHIIEGTIDVRTPLSDENRIRQLNTALRINAAKDVFRRYAREYVIKDKNIPVSRLRLMLSEAVSYPDLQNLVGSMKTSDRSSENEKGKRLITQELLKDFYGEESDPLSRILKTEPGLYEEIVADNEAKEQVKKMWKLPMDILLHNMHYQKRG